MKTLRLLVTPLNALGFRQLWMTLVRTWLRPVWAAACLMLLAAAPNAFADASNIVVNSSFEAGPFFFNGWQTNGAGDTVSPGQAFEGTNWVTVRGLTPIYVLTTNVTTNTFPIIGVVVSTSITYVATSSNHAGLLSQDVATQAGTAYSVQFAVRGSGVEARVLWDGQTIGAFSNATFTNWTVTNFTAVATGTNARLTFENSTTNSRGLDLDGISVSSLTEPASIIAQPQGRSGFEGSAVALRVVAGGVRPLQLQWLHQGTTIPDTTNATLLITNLQTADAGSYQVVVSNAFGSATSSVVSLAVDPLPQEPLIIVQPDGRTLAAGYSATLVAVAVGSPPLRYQWHKNGVPLSSRTNAALVLTNMLATDSGVYHAVVSNSFGSATSLTATMVATNGLGGGQFTLYNGLTPWMAAPAFVFDTDGVTRLAGSNFVAQAYAGPSPTDMHPVGLVRFFKDGAFAGLFFPVLVTLADVVAGQTAYVQVRIWERTVGETYEAARARGGRYGCSEVMTVQCGGVPVSGGLPAPLPPTELYQPRSISLQAGQPLFSTGRIGVLPAINDSTFQWSLTGEPGSTYVIEKRVPPAGWLPFQVLQNVSGSVSFVDTNTVQTNVVLYRARLLN